MSKMVQLDNIFDLEYGNRDYTDKSTLDTGNTLLISSQGVDNGAYGFYDIPSKYKPPIITVPRTGSIGHAFVQLNACNVTDDCIILTPKKKYSTEYLFYVSCKIRKIKWRYNYGRKITPNRLANLNIIHPDGINIKLSYNHLFSELYPKRNNIDKKQEKVGGHKEYMATELFDMERGQFHAIDKLENGTNATISRIQYDNGLVGFYKKPRKAKIYPPLNITVSTVTGDAFLQINPFIATDNVLVCLQKKKLRITTLLYIVACINKVKWRYSYGRQPYKRIFQKTKISLPIDCKNELNEKYIASIVERQPYWRYFMNKYGKASND